MNKKRVVWFLAPALAAAIVVACSDKDKPTNPNNPTPVVEATLKADAPSCLSPKSIVADSRTPTLVISNVAGKYADAPLSYRFQVQDETGAVFEEGVANAGADGKTSYTLRNRLAIDKNYTWTARSEYQGAYGPWSEKAPFTSPHKLEAYMNGNELYEPLIDGAPSPLVHSYGHVDWYEGVGVGLIDRYAWVQWLIPTLVEGEVSFEAIGVRNDRWEWKTKIMSMEDWGAGNTTDNPYRVTIDKRTEWLGQGSRVRFTMRSRNDDAGEPVGPKGEQWSKTQVYGWRFTWKGLSGHAGGQADLYVYEGGFGGPVKRHLSTKYHAPYDPNNHCVRLGSPFGRFQKESLPDVIIRHLWVSSNPRPADLGK